MLLKKNAILAFGLFTFCTIGIAVAQTPPTAEIRGQGQVQGQSQAQAQTPTPGQGPAQTTEAPPEKETWKAPFGGTFTATFAAATDYSYRGISQTQRQVAVQPSFTYETPTVSQNVALSAYVGAWGSNVYFGNTNPTIAEVDLIAGLRLKALNDKLTGDLGYIRYNYLGSPGDLFYDFNEFGLVLGYDFGVAAIQGAVRYSPNFFGNSGIAWYKWGQVTVPMPLTPSTRTSPSRSMARSATSMSSASPTTASATTTTGTGRSASPPRSMASISPSPTSTPTSTSPAAPPP